LALYFSLGFRQLQHETNARMILLFDIGNTNTHLGLATSRRIVKQADVSTEDWLNGGVRDTLLKFTGRNAVEGVAFCSVVPRTTPLVLKAVWQLWKVDSLELTPKTVRGVGIDYPKPKSIGPDRLANAVAARHHFGAPSVVVDFGTAVTFDVVNRAGNYIGGIIAPGLAAMTDYLHEKTALLPRIKIREVNSAIGKSTEHAMLVGAVHGYRGLIRGLLGELKRELKTQRLPVIATGGYAKLIASKMPEIAAVRPELTLEGLRLTWQAHAK
jgi:type III pantothenate kinase